MTREDACEIWLPIIKMGVKSMPECSEALDMAITALKQEPCTDAISRQAVLNLAKFDGRDGLGSIIHAFDVEQLPPVTSAEKVGHWEQTRYRSIDQTGESYDDGIGFRCSNCANVFKVTSLARYHFCPNCGSRMMQASPTGAESEVQDADSD